MVKRGDRVFFKPEYSDSMYEGLLVYIAINDMEKGRVDVKCINTGMTYPPIQTVADYMITNNLECEK